MNVIEFEQKGDFKKTTSYLLKLSRHKTPYEILDKYGKKGVAALSSATPYDTGLTSESWSYEIEDDGNGHLSLSFYNSNINKYVNIALILQYGHATRSGSWVEGVDYINPALQPIFDKLSKELWKEVTST